MQSGTYKDAMHKNENVPNYTASIHIFLSKVWWVYNVECISLT